MFAEFDVQVVERDPETGCAYGFKLAEFCTGHHLGHGFSWGAPAVEELQGEMRELEGDDERECDATCNFACCVVFHFSGLYVTRAC